MKSAIIGIASTFLYCIILIASFDSKMLLVKYKELAMVSKELSATGTIFLDYSEYADGYIVFKDSESIAAIDAQIKDMLKLQNNLHPKDGAYWVDDIEYTVIYFDHSSVKRVYKNGVLQSSTPLPGGKGECFPVLYEDEDTGYTKTISEPTVIVKIDAGKPRIRLGMIKDAFKDSRVIRTASHSWTEYDGF